MHWSGLVILGRPLLFFVVAAFVGVSHDSSLSETVQFEMCVGGFGIASR